MKKFILASLAVFVAMFVLEFVIHGILMKGLYESTASVWRPQEEANSMMWLMSLGYLLFAPIFVLIYSKGYEEGKSPIGQGLRYGFWAGLLLTVMPQFIWYVVLPIPSSLPVVWFISGMVTYVLLGLVVGAIYRKES